MDLRKGLPPWEGVVMKRTHHECWQPMDLHNGRTLDETWAGKTRGAWLQLPQLQGPDAQVKHVYEKHFLREMES